MQITIEHNPVPMKLEVMAVESWPIWQRDVDVFDWHYDVSETCYFIAGEVVVTPKAGEAVTLKKGDLVTFPAGMDCTWDIRKAVKKHYQMGS